MKEKLSIAMLTCIGMSFILVAMVAIAAMPGGVEVLSMAALAIGAVVTHQRVTKSHNTHRNGYKVASGKVLHGGTLAFLSATGFATDVIASAIGFAGVVVETVDNTGGADGALKVECYEDGRFLLTGSGFAQTHVKQPCYATDNYTVTATQGSNVRIGTIDEVVSATQVWVMLEKHAA